MQPDPQDAPPAHEAPAGPVCAQSALPWWARLAITFAVLFGLKWALPAAGLAPRLQVLSLLLVATLFIWRFWWNCSPDRRGALLLGGSLWAAGLAKIALG
ncbi:MAG: hypothetical protein ACXWC2_08695 [Ramlibacter sp.]